MFDKSKKDIIRDVKKASAVYVAVHGMIEHDTHYVKTTRVSILDAISEVEDGILFQYHIDDFGDINIG
ncbi:unnamed protein product [marine sediment metagenome]|uniref:Uncharacterized protein n=1 Tax=marine sediment metagenome TaxID=412755 RepID=X0W204_9ZZZZ